MKYLNRSGLMFTLSLIAFFVLTACTGSSKFSGSTTARGKQSQKLQNSATKDSSGNPNAGIANGDPKLLGKNLALSAEVNSSFTENSIWLAHTSANVYKILLNKAKNYPYQTWSGVSSASGRRTFISEIGLLVCGTSVGLYRVDDNVPEAGKGQLIWSGTSGRCCPTSFKMGGKPYVGVGYLAADSSMHFSRFPIDKTTPTMVDTSKLEDFVITTNGAYGAYSCYTDQLNGIYWAQNGNNTTIFGINMITGKAVDSSGAPNSSRAMNIPGVIDFNVAHGGSYALQGDPKGNVLTAPSSYAMTYDPVSDTVFRSIYGGNTVTAFDGACFRAGNVDCTNKYWTFTSPLISNIGPMSSLNDGRIVGLSRSDGSVFLISLVDNKDRSKGINVEKIQQIAGDPYMYADFTGATLYASTASHTFDLTSIPEFAPKAPVQSAELRWHAEPGTLDTWGGLKLSIRCFKKTDATKPDLSPVAHVPDAGTAISLEAIPSCSKKDYDQVEIKIEPDGVSGTSFSKTKNFDFTAKQ